MDSTSRRYRAAKRYGCMSSCASGSPDTNAFLSLKCDAPICVTLLHGVRLGGVMFFHSCHDRRDPNQSIVGAAHSVSVDLNDAATA